MNRSTISRRFLFSKKSHSLVNLVAIVSVVALAVPTAAMIIVLSLQSGLSGLVHDIYSKFDAPLRITPSSGQYLEVDSAALVQLNEFAEVTTMVDCNVLLEWNGFSAGGVMRGVDSSYATTSALPSAVTRGQWKTLHGSLPRAVVGAGLSYNLAMTLGAGRTLKVSAIIPSPKLGVLSPSVPLISSGTLVPAGVFSIDASLDAKYIYTDIDYVRSLIAMPRALSAVELYPRVEESEARAEIARILGEDVTVKNRYEQRSLIYSAIDAEKYIIFIVLVFIAIIAVMSLGGCTLMMCAEKADGAKLLRALGMSSRAVRGVFVSLSGRVVVFGIGAGAVLGIGFCLLQKHFGVVKVAADSFMVESYPIALHFEDICIALLAMSAIGYGVIWIAIGRMKF